MDVSFLFDKIWNVKYSKLVDAACTLTKTWADRIIGRLNALSLPMELLIKAEGLNVENLSFH